MQQMNSNYGCMTAVTDIIWVFWLFLMFLLKFSKVILRSLRYKQLAVPDNFKLNSYSSVTAIPDCIG